MYLFLKTLLLQRVAQCPRSSSVAAAVVVAHMLAVAAVLVALSSKLLRFLPDYHTPS